MRPIRTALVALLALAASGCQDNAASIEIFALCAPPDDAESCSFAGACDAYLASPRPYVFTSVGGATNQLEMFVQVNNQMPSSEDLTVGRVNTKDFVIEAYLLEFRGLALPKVVYPASFTVPAASSATPVVPLIPASTMARIRELPGLPEVVPVVVELRLRGELRDGTTIETDHFDVPVDVRNADFAFGCGDGATPTWCPNAGQTASVACPTP